ncbi:fumarylacetoacetate hydrolase family protein [Sphingomonas sp.]|uniref:fumarylacetoacetate hydrolase family protein n=1 Tax=Sphingomonas sp. TaxID=28214 RepID=UPI0035BC0821
MFGYTVCNDVSARDWQRHSPPFTIGKSFDTHGPLGPWIVTADKIADPHALRLRSFVNGEPRQDGNTGELVYDVWDQIAYMSTALTLDPGDLLATGTPDGVGVAMIPPHFCARRCRPLRGRGHRRDREHGTRPMSAIETDVLVVGAGPVGSAARRPLELRRRAALLSGGFPARPAAHLRAGDGEELRRRINSQFLDCPITANVTVHRMDVDGFRSAG